MAISRSAISKQIDGQLRGARKNKKTKLKVKKLKRKNPFSRKFTV